MQQVRDQIGAAEKVLVLLDSNHSQAHVAAELEAGPSEPWELHRRLRRDHTADGWSARTEADWIWNNPISAVQWFLADHPEFEAHEPEWPFNEGVVRQRVSYWPHAYLRRR